MREILGMEGNARERRPALEGPAGARHHDRAPGAKGVAGAPADRRRRHSPARRKQADDGFVLAEVQPAGAGGAVTLVAREPRRRDEAYRVKPERTEPRAAARDPLARGRLVQRQKLALPGSAAPGSKLVPQSPRQADFVVALTVEEDLGTVGDAPPEPAH